MTFVDSSLLLFCGIGLPINFIMLREPVLGRDLAAAIKCVLVITGARLIQITRALHLLLQGQLLFGMRVGHCLAILPQFRIA